MREASREQLIETIKELEDKLRIAITIIAEESVEYAWNLTIQEIKFLDEIERAETKIDERYEREQDH